MKWFKRVTCKNNRCMYFRPTALVYCSEKCLQEDVYWQAREIVDMGKEVTLEAIQKIAQERNGVPEKLFVRAIHSSAGEGNAWILLVLKKGQQDVGGTPSSASK